MTSPTSAEFIVISTIERSARFHTKFVQQRPMRTPVFIVTIGRLHRRPDYGECHVQTATMGLQTSKLWTFGFRTVGDTSPTWSHSSRRAGLQPRR
jgi:hypothetical protein